MYTSKGKGGGIRLLDNFVLDKTLFSDKEQNELLLSLQSMKVTEYPDIDTILSKLKAIFNKENTDWIEIDFSQWGSAHFQKELFIDDKRGYFAQEERIYALSKFKWREKH